MIITRTPYRISFFGGGTDYPAWYLEHGGKVLGTTIDKYCYISCRYLPPFFPHKHRIVYSQIESVDTVEEIEHPSVAACFRYLGIDKGIEIHHDGDLPARSGMGSSSAFTVGLLQALFALRRRMVAPKELANIAIHVEQEIIREDVGSQDQMFAAVGGFNRIDFHPDGSIDAAPVILPQYRLEELQAHLMLVFTGLSRNASEIAAAVIENTPRRHSQLGQMTKLVDAAQLILANGSDITGFGELLNETWLLKRELADSVTSREIDEMYEAARKEGAIGGKLLGAGGGGFFLFFAKPEHQPKIKQRLRDLLHVPFAFSSQGTQVVYFNSEYKTYDDNGKVLPFDLAAAVAL